MNNPFFSELNPEPSYPRLCAHRGFSAAMPENSLPALASAVVLGAQEIEFDLRTTCDGVIVSIHDPCLDRVSNGHGMVEEHTFEELRALDFSGEYTRFRGLQIPTFEEILQKLVGQTVMNIHAKIWEGDHPADRLEEIVSLIRRYRCERQIYFAANSSEACRIVKEYDPNLCYCLIWNGKESAAELVDRAILAGADKVQLASPMDDAECIKRAHAHGIRCNLFYADDPLEAKRYFEMGIDTILTNEYLLLKQSLEI